MTEKNTPFVYKVLDAHLSLRTTQNTRDQLDAFAWYWDRGGKYNRAARILLDKAIARELAEMSTEEKKRYDEIMEAVKKNRTLSNLIKSE